MKTIACFEVNGQTKGGRELVETILLRDNEDGGSFSVTSIHCCGREAEHETYASEALARAAVEVKCRDAERRIAEAAGAE